MKILKKETTTVLELELDFDEGEDVFQEYVEKGGYSILEEDVVGKDLLKITLEKVENMNNKIPYWKLIQDLSFGAYLLGDVFENQRGEIAYVDIKGNLELPGHYIDPSDEWEYVEYAE